MRDSGDSYYLFFLATFHFAHRARCAAAIRFRPAADILRLGRLPRERLKPLRTEIALSSAFYCACSLLRSLCRSRTVLDRSATIPRGEEFYQLEVWRFVEQLGLSGHAADQLLRNRTLKSSLFRKRLRTAHCIGSNLGAGRRRSSFTISMVWDGRSST